MDGASGAKTWAQILNITKRKIPPVLEGQIHEVIFVDLQITPWNIVTELGISQEFMTDFKKTKLSRCFVMQLLRPDMQQIWHI